MKPTIKDVAKKANVSVSTVSRVLNNKGYVNETTKAAIQKVIDSLGFVPNQLARSLSNRTSGVIGIMFPHIDPFYTDLLFGIETQASTYDYKTILCNTNDNPEKEEHFLEFFTDYNIEGVIIASNFKNVEALNTLEIPIITVDHIWDSNIPSISSDNIMGGELAAKHLIDCKSKNIAVFRGPSFLLTTIERTIGFNNIINKHDDISVQMFDFDLVNPDYYLVLEILKSNPTIDGIFCLSDTLAIITIKALNDLGRKPGVDVSVIGYDNLKIGKWITPTVTTIDQNTVFLGKQAFMTLYKHIKHNNLEIEHEVVDVNLVIRNSTIKK